MRSGEVVDGGRVAVDVDGDDIVVRGYEEPAA
jgi:hypothetical protein